MPCKQCGCVLEPTDVDEPSDTGTFTEQWECINCNATGTIEGKEEQPPYKWSKYGRAFQDPAGV